MTTTQQHVAALARLYGPGITELRETIQTAAFTLGEAAGDFRTRAHVDVALATVTGLQRHLLRLREQLPEVGE